jgi:hypothetical protein
MKPLHKINTCALAVNLLLFIVPCFGMLAMIPLGLIQLLIAAGVSLNYYRQLDKQRQKLIQGYWLFVVIDFIGIAALYYFKGNSYYFDFIPLFILPGCIAIYFVYTTYSTTKYLNQQP